MIMSKVKSSNINNIRRLSVYIRDEFQCMYCLKNNLTHDIVLTIDHIRPRSHGGENHVKNMISSCKDCNDSRQSRQLITFAQEVAAWTDQSYVDILHRIEKHRNIPTNYDLAKSIRTYLKGVGNG